MSELISGGDCRTALATPGLLKRLTNFNKKKIDLFNKFTSTFLKEDNLGVAIAKKSVDPPY